MKSEPICNSIVDIIRMEGLTDYSKSDYIEASIVNGLKDFFRSSYGIVALGEIIKPGTRIVIKPNFVNEENFRSRFDGDKMDNPNDCFITNWVFIKATVTFLSKVDGIKISILECPLQSCNISKIVTEKNLTELRSINKSNTIEFIDGRRTKYVYTDREPEILHDCRDESQYVNFNLDKESLHCRFDDKVNRFRVTDYPPSEMKNYHSVGKHRYKIAKEIIEADFIFSVPKLKTHMKSGITIAMKNFVGVVGNKECLPHHIKGPKCLGGDCYGDFSLLKILSENLIDKANAHMLDNPKKYYSMRRFALSFLLFRWLICLDKDITGCWYGNDTISRTIVDLNRIVYYGGKDGKLHEVPQRIVISVVDAVVSGQGEGPMRPTPLYSGFFCISDSTAAADCVCSKLIGINPDKIAFLKRDRISGGKYPLLSDIDTFDIRIDGQSVCYSEIESFVDAEVAPRWIGHIEKKPGKRFTYTRQFFSKLSHYRNHLRTIWKMTAKERGRH